MWMFIVMLMFSACQGPMGPAGKNGLDGTAQWLVATFQVSSEHWRVVEEDDWYFFESEIEFPELTEFVFMEGAVLCYLIQHVQYAGERNPTRVHSLLPHTVYGEYDDGWPYSENYSCELRPGWINFTVKYSDWAPDIQPPSRLFHVVLMW